MTFLHTMIRVKDIEKSLKFYQNLFGMEVTDKKRLDDCWLYFLKDKESNAQLELTYNDKIPKEGYNIGNGFGHFAFGVKSFDDFTKLLVENNYQYLYEPFDLIGLKIAFIKDPDGYEIEIIENSNY